jgi:D-alanyl-D-alanine carboxypeptidase (penicillin-binding protein 5/6)
MSTSRVTADGAILIDGETGQVLFEKQGFKIRPPASTTKIITAVLGLENADPKDVVVVSEKAGRTPGSSIYLHPGEQISLGELVEGALVRSGNDACVAIAEHLAGSEEHFAHWMSLKAFALGARNSEFINSNGLTHKKHLTTPYDLAQMARYGLKNQTFSAIVKQRTAYLERQGWPKQINNTNRLLWSYPFADVVKTGTTNAAGQCLVASATKGKKKLIAVVLHSDDRFGDCSRLLEYGFNLPAKKVP